MAATGWTWEYIDENMTLPRLAVMNKHWNVAPPVHISLARLNGALLEKAPEAEKADGGDNKGLQDFIGDFLSGGGKIDGA